MEDDNDAAVPSSSSFSENPEDIQLNLSPEHGTVYVGQLSPSQYVFSTRDHDRVNICGDCDEVASDSTCHDRFLPNGNNEMPSHSRKYYTLSSSKNHSDNEFDQSNSILNSIPYDYLSTDENLGETSRHQNFSQNNNARLSADTSQPSTSKEVSYTHKSIASKRYLDRCCKSIDPESQNIFPDSNEVSHSFHPNNESAEQKTILSPFKKRITIARMMKYDESSSDSEEDCKLDLSPSICSSLSTHNTPRLLNNLGCANAASTSEQVQMDNIVETSSPPTPGEPCLVSSSTGHIDSISASHNSLQPKGTSHVYPDEVIDPPVLDSTVDSTSEQHILSPYSDDSHEDIRTSKCFFQNQLEDSRGEISTSMTHLHSEEDSDDMDLLVNSGGHFSKDLQDQHFISLANSNAHSFHTNLTVVESSQDIESVLVPSCSSYYDSMAIAGPSGISTQSKRSSNNAHRQSPCLSLSTNDNHHSNQESLPHCSSQSSLSQVLDLEMAGMEAESSDYRTSDHLSGPFVLGNSSTNNIGNLQCDYSCRALSHFSGSYNLKIDNTSLSSGDIEGNYISDANEQNMNDESLQINDQLQDESNTLECCPADGGEASNSLQATYELSLVPHQLKEILESQQMHHSLLPPTQLLQESQHSCGIQLPSKCLDYHKTTSKPSCSNETDLDSRTFNVMKSDPPISKGHLSDNHSPTECSDMGSISFTEASSFDETELSKSLLSTVESMNSSNLDYKMSKGKVNDSVPDRSSRLRTTHIKIPNNIGDESGSWCDDCGCFLKFKCDVHRIQTIVDKPVLKRAWASLPVSYLCIKEITSEAGTVSSGVFTKRFIVKRTQFGPMDGKCIKEGSSSLSLPFPVTRQEDLYFVDTSDEESSNWMRFVRKADAFLDINCIVIEKEENIYFLTTADLQPKTELRFGYSKQYAQKYGKECLVPTTEEIKDLEAMTKTWACFECDEQFSTSAELQKHLSSHDEVLSRKPKKRGKCRIKKVNTTSVVSKKPRPKVNVVVNDQPKLFNSEASDVFKCEECSLSFQSDKLLEIHAKIHFYGNKDFSEEEWKKISEEENLCCPFCSLRCSSIKTLIDHAKKHTLSPEGNREKRSHKCGLCYKTFTDMEKKEKHLQVHKDDSEKPFCCCICSGRFCNKSALGSHLKFHSNSDDKMRTYECPICREKFFSVVVLKRHFPSHCINDEYTCPTCSKKFPSYYQIRRHIRSYHTAEHPCPECSKILPSLEKLKIHRVIHSDRRDFACSICLRAFKRKDKMKEHVKRVHSRNKEPRKKKFTPKLEPKEYKMFAYKCVQCMLGFKRRGMLVNHLSNRHPTIELSSIPELNQPLLRKARSYFCQYCQKSYVSSTKRKLHILKCHPGKEVPSPKVLMKEESPDSPTKVYPASCHWCPKQYATKAKLLQHIRKRHGHLIDKEKEPKKDQFLQQIPEDKILDMSSHHSASESVVKLIPKDAAASYYRESGVSTDDDVICDERYENVRRLERRYVRLGEGPSSSNSEVGHPLELNLSPPKSNSPDNAYVSNSIQASDQMFVNVPSTSNPIFVAGNLDQGGGGGGAGTTYAVLTADGSDGYTFALRPGHLLQSLGSISLVSAELNDEADTCKRILQPQDISLNLSRGASMQGSSHIMVTNSAAEELSEDALRDNEPSQVVVWHPFTQSRTQ